MGRPQQVTASLKSLLLQLIGGIYLIFKHQLSKRLGLSPSLSCRDGKSWQLVCCITVCTI